MHCLSAELPAGGTLSAVQCREIDYKTAISNLDLNQYPNQIREFICEKNG
jgi:hypothetical protein